MGLRDLITLKACAAMFNGIVPEERLRELALSGHLPHVLVDGEPCVKWNDVEAWVNKNLVTLRCSGSNLPGVVTIPKGPRDLPEALRPVGPMLKAIKMLEYPPGIYFLCREGRLLYVGQSVTPLLRVWQHRKIGKDFEQAFYVSVPIERLNEVEGALIRYFRPELNGHGPRPSVNGDAAVLTEFGLAPQIVS